MRVAGFALLGFVSGAIIGLISAVLFVTLWYDVLGFGRHGPDGLNGVGTLIMLALLLPPLFGVAGAGWMGLRGARTAPAGGPSCALVVALVLVPLIILLMTFLFGAVWVEEL